MVWDAVSAGVQCLALDIVPSRRIAGDQRIIVVGESFGSGGATGGGGGKRVRTHILDSESGGA